MLAHRWSREPLSGRQFAGTVRAGAQVLHDCETGRVGQGMEERCDPDVAIYRHTVNSCPE
jgi:hypothetical protein